MSQQKQTPDVALEDVKIRSDISVRGINDIRFSDEGVEVNDKEYLLKVPGVGSFYACDGKIVEYSAEEGADPEWLQLYLNNQVLVALLHQRKIISFHASSFIYGGQGVMILGETGAGKTSMTVAFAINGAGFMSDDLTPVVLRENVPLIWSLNRKVKLRADSIEQLDIFRGNLSEAESGTGKKYLHIDKGSDEYHRLDVIVKIEAGNVDEPAFMTLALADRFALLRSEVCSWEILAGMPETEAAYLQQLVQILKKVHFVKVVRPAMITIAGMHNAMRQYLDSLS
jgi:hypothetical protein